MSTQKSLLLIEDDRLLRQLYLHILTTAGYSVVYCQTATQAERILVQKPTKHFSLILLDVMLPDQSGLKFLPHLRQLTSTPVILLTNFDQPSIKKEALQQGAMDYLVKNECTPDIFLYKIADCLASTTRFR